MIAVTPPGARAARARPQGRGRELARREECGRAARAPLRPAPSHRRINRIDLQIRRRYLTRRSVMKVPRIPRFVFAIAVVALVVSYPASAAECTRPGENPIVQWSGAAAAGSTVRVYFRADLNADEHFVEMMRETPTTMQAVLPRVSNETRRIDYRIVSVSGENERTLFSGLIGVSENCRTSATTLPASNRIVLGKGSSSGTLRARATCDRTGAAKTMVRRRALLQPGPRRRRRVPVRRWPAQRDVNRCPARMAGAAEAVPPAAMASATSIMDRETATVIAKTIRDQRMDTTRTSRPARRFPPRDPDYFLTSAE